MGDHIHETCGHEAATLRDYGAGGFMLVCDPCDAESEASLSFCASSTSEALAEMDREPGISDRKITEIIRAVLEADKRLARRDGPRA